MNFKMVFSGCLVLLFVLVVSACGSNGVKGNGKATEIDLKEVKVFMDDKKTGFLYVKSAFEDNQEEEMFQIEEIHKVAKAENIDFYIFNAEEDKEKNSVKQYSRTFAFYQDGDMKEELDFSDFSEDDVPSEVEKFVQNVKEDYLK